MPFARRDQRQIGQDLVLRVIARGQPGLQRQQCNADHREHDDNPGQNRKRCSELFGGAPGDRAPCVDWRVSH